MRQSKRIESAIGYAIEEMRKAKGLTNPHGYALKIARDKTQRENARASEAESQQYKDDLKTIDFSQIAKGVVQ